MEQKLHNINDLYEFMQFDNNIQDSWKTPRCPFPERDWWVNFDEDEDKTNSLLLYRKGNHESFSKLFSRHYLENSNRSYEPLGNANWYVPYKDPVDKLLGGFLSTDYFAQKHNDLFHKDYSDLYEQIEPILLQFVDIVLSGKLPSSAIYDNHLTPLSIVLEKALIDNPQFRLSRLVGLNLDTKDSLYHAVYDPIIQKHGMSQQIFQLALKRRSPYGGNKKHYLDMFKYNHAPKIKELVHGPLYNEYKLLNFFVHHMYYKEKFYNG